MVTVALDPPTGPYEYNTVVTMAPLPATGYHFVNWTGDIITSTDSLQDITMTEDKEVMVHFATNESPGWASKESMPSQVSGKYVADGGALVTVNGTKDGDVIYAFRGKSREFYQYTPGTPGVWTWLRMTAYLMV